MALHQGEGFGTTRRSLVVGAALALGCSGDPSAPPDRVDADLDGHLAEGDCDDGDPAVYPGAPERCDGVDQDCDGSPEPHVVRWTDGDGDGWGAGAEQVLCGDVPAGLVSNNLDCADADPAIHPNADEVPCAGLDANCDGTSLRPGSVALADGPSYYDVGAALDAAPSGAVVSVCPGLYPLSHTLTRSVTLRSFGGSAATVLQVGAGSLLTVGPGADVVVEGFTLARTEAAGTAAVVAESADVILRDVVVSGHYGFQAALEVSGGSLTLDRSRVVDSQNWVAGGADVVISSGGGIRGVGADITLLDSQVAFNDAAGTGGGGLSLDGGQLVLVRSEVRGNVAAEGGGVWMTDAALVLDAASEIRGNTGARGGGVYLLRSTISGGTIADNQQSGVLVGPGAGSALVDLVLTGNTAVWGGGLSVEGTASLSNVSVEGNTASWLGGGLAVVESTFGDPSVTLDPATAVVGNLSNGGGGAAWTSGELVSLGAWWGALGVDANEPSTIGYATFEEWEVSGAGSFRCTADGCDP
ncbi:MAG: MopE-related protein [Myxococcota bacterium]